MQSATLPVRKVIINKNGGCLREGVWDDIPMFAIVTGENGTGKSQLLHALGRSVGAQVDPPSATRSAVVQTPPYGNAGVSLEGYSLKGGSVFYSPSAWTLSSGTSASEEMFNERVAELHRRPGMTLSNGQTSEWRNDPAYAAFVLDESAPNPRIESMPSLTEFRDGLTPLHLAFPVFHAPTQFSLPLYFLAYEILSANLRFKGESEAEITKRFGEPPWDLLNEILAAAALSFRVSPPARVAPSVFSQTTHQYQLFFVDEHRKTTFPFESLSSGEKVIVSTLLWRLTAEGAGNFFQLLLLDEPDAHLHPSMVKRFLSVIANVFVKARNVAVIMTTHSPTTVALAPADSLFILEREAGGIPRKSEKDEALRRLTTGVPALSIAYEHRRQIFVEAPSDAEFYEQIYVAHRDRFSPDISFEFIAVGGGQGGGCAQVIYIVEKLVEAGNQWVYGLIDRDEGNNATERVRVAGDKHSIENYLFDPLILAIHLKRLNLWRDPDFSALMDVPYWKLLEEPAERLERICTHIGGVLLTSLFELNVLLNDSAAKVDRSQLEVGVVARAKALFELDANRFVWAGQGVVVEYAGGVKIRQPGWFSNMRGHDLEFLVRRTFQELKSHKVLPSGDMRRTLLADLPALAPADVLNTLLDIQSHVRGIKVR